MNTVFFSSVFHLDDGWGGGRGNESKNRKGAFAGREKKKRPKITRDTIQAKT